MRAFLTVTVALGLSLAGAAALWAEAGPEAPEGAWREGGEPVTLMGLMEEWYYPQALMPEGAAMSGGDVAGVYPMKCQAVLTTPDAVEDVIAFYEKKLGIDAEGNGVEADGRSTASLDDSKGRGITVRVFSVGSAESTVTLVVSRGPEDETTHIAWTEFLRLPVAR
jgi:hypothetical protein